jgi:hypothetical protein
MCVLLCLCLVHITFGYHQNCDRLLLLFSLFFGTTTGKIKKPNSILKYECRCYERLRGNNVGGSTIIDSVECVYFQQNKNDEHCLVVY